MLSLSFIRLFRASPSQCRAGNETMSTSSINTFAMEIEIVHRFSLVRISYCMGTSRVKQKRKQTKVFTNHVGGFVDSYSGSCSK